MCRSDEAFKKLMSTFTSSPPSSSSSSSSRARPASTAPRAIVADRVALDIASARRSRGTTSGCARWWSNFINLLDDDDVIVVRMRRVGSMSTRIDVAVDDDDGVDDAAPAMVSGATAAATARRRGGRASGARVGVGGYGGGAGAASAVAAAPRLDDFTDEENAARFIRKNRWVAFDVGPFPVRVCGDDCRCEITTTFEEIA